jgi:hypothetical protein
LSWPDTEANPTELCTGVFEDVLRRHLCGNCLISRDLGANATEQQIELDEPVPHNLDHFLVTSSPQRRIENSEWLFRPSGPTIHAAQSPVPLNSPDRAWI